MAEAHITNPQTSVRFKPTTTNDPLVGTQQHPDQSAEYLHEPEREAAVSPTHGTAVKSRLLAGVLGLLLGWLGAHRFYLGFVKVGLFQLGLTLLAYGIAFAIGLPRGEPLGTILLTAHGVSMLVWIWGAVEGVMILAGMMEHDAEARPLR
jgi:TM2 domain-containing membrane protein YozV